MKPAVAVRTTVRFCTAIGAAMLLRSAVAAEAPPPMHGVVRLRVTHQEADPFLPWRKQQPGQRLGYAAAISGGRLLTTEAMVRNHTMVAIEVAVTGRRIPARVVLADHEAGLALLQAAANADGQRLEVAEAFDGDKTVEILQYDDTSAIEALPARITDIAVTGLPQSPNSALTLEVLTDLRIAGSGAPVLQNGRLAGLTISHAGDGNTARVLPCTRIRRFLRDLEDGDYAGVAFAGIVWKALTDPVMRAYLRVPPDAGGVLITACIQGTPAASVVRPNDVVLEWDGHPIDSLGYYRDERFGRLQLSHLISGKRQPGDKVKVVLVRDGASARVDLELGRRAATATAIPEAVTGEQPEYLVAGGLVLRQLTGHYLRAHGPAWQRTVNSRLVWLYLNRDHIAGLADCSGVILSAVLPDPINIGYEGLRDRSVEAVNGTPVRDMDDVFRVVETDGGLRSVSLHGSGVDLVLDSERLKAANDRISEQYRIRPMAFRRAGG